jgi:hypothetical protein
MVRGDAVSLIWFGDQIKAQISEQVDRKLQACGQDLKQRSSDQAPVDTGDLRGNCAASEVRDHELRVGYSLPYALRQHEELGYRHPKGGKAKYLEDPFNENAHRYIRYIGEGLVK